MSSNDYSKITDLSPEKNTVVTSNNPSLRYYPQLDAVRAIAVLLVLVSHFVVHSNQFIGVRLRLMGELGVDSFFVLSGFLITSILLQSKKKIESHFTTTAKALKGFYLRRALRIFPIYYLLIIPLAFMSLYHYRIDKQNVLAAATYTINYLIPKQRDWGEIAGHYWSLAVEEQFYLFWPFVVLLVKRKWLLPVLVFTICFSIVYGCINYDEEYGYISTISCMSALGSGGLFAYVKEHRENGLPFFYRLTASLALVACLVFAYIFVKGIILPVPHRNLTSFMALFVIVQIVCGKIRQRFNPFYFLFNSRVLQFIGRISYGIYLYHFIVVYAVDYVVRKIFHKNYLAFHIQTTNPLFMLLCFAAIVLVSWLSYRFIEQPILKLKERL